MHSTESQKQKILKLDIKDKKLTRLFSYSELSDRDSLFLNYVYEQKQQLYFKYAFGVTFLTMIFAKQVLFKFQRGFISVGAILGIGALSHFSWSNTINKRFNRFVNPYFQKYGIK